MCKITTTNKKDSSTKTSRSSDGTNKNAGDTMGIHIDGINTIRAGKRVSGTVSIPLSIRRAIEAAESAEIVKASSSPSFSFEDEEKASVFGATGNNLDKDNSNGSPKLCIYLEFVGKETTVVSTPKTYARPETFDIKYLKKNRGEYGLLYRKGIELVGSFDDIDGNDTNSSCGDSDAIMIPFQFTLPPNLPCSMEYVGKYQEKYALPHQWYARFTSLFTCGTKLALHMLIFSLSVSLPSFSASLINTFR